MGRIKAWLFRKNKDRCAICGRKLTLEEIKYYDTTCEKCERRFYKRVNKELGIRSSKK